MGRCKCGNHECKIVDGSTSNLLRHLRISHAKEFDAKLQLLEAQGKNTNRMTNYYSKVGAWKPDSPSFVSLERKITKFFVATNQSHSLIENDNFRD